MRVGLRFYSAGEQRELWSTVGLGGKGEAWGKIQSIKIDYADMEITECTVTFTNPSDDLIRAFLALCVIEPSPLDDTYYNTASIWVLDPRFGYDPLPIFVGLILKCSVSDRGVKTLSIVMEDFKRLQSLARDIQDYQNLTDQDVAAMLLMRLREATTVDGKTPLLDLVVDRDAMSQKRTATSIGSVRQWVAQVEVDPKLIDRAPTPIAPMDGATDPAKRRTQPRMIDMTPLQKLRYYANALGFTTREEPAVRPDKTAYVKVTIVPKAGALENPSGTYQRGDGEVLDFSWSYDPPGQVMQRNVMSKRFDPVNEMWMLEHAKSCIKMNLDGTITDKEGNALPPGAIRNPIVPTDANSKPLSLDEYRSTMSPFIKSMADDFGAGSKKTLREYHDKIAYRKGMNVPGTTPQTLTEPSSGTKDIASFNEDMSQQGTLFWRITAKLTVRFNPLLTSTDSLKLTGWGVLDGVYSIQSFTHNLSEQASTSFSLTYGDPVRLSG